MEKIFIILAIQAVYSSDFGKKHLTDNEYVSIPYPVVENGNQFVVFTFFKRDGARPDSKQRIYLPHHEAKIAFPSKEISIKELKVMQKG